MTTPYRFPIESYAAAILVVRRAEADGAITPAEAHERRAQLWRLALVHPDVEPVRDFAYGAAVGRQDRERWIEAQRHGDTIPLPCRIDGSTDWGRGYAWGWDQHRAADPHDPPVPAHPWDGLMVDRGEV